MEEIKLKLCLPPNQSSYTVSESQAPFLRTQLQGGLGRYRRDILDSSYIVNAEWTVDCVLFNFIQALYRNFLETTTPFLIDLIIGEAGLREFTAYFIPGSFKISRVNGLIYTISAQLEVEAPEVDPCFDTLYLYLFTLFGPNFEEEVNKIDFVTNTRLPKIMPFGVVEGVLNGQ